MFILMQKYITMPYILFTINRLRVVKFRELTAIPGGLNQTLHVQGVVKVIIIPVFPVPESHVPASWDRESLTRSDAA